MTRSSWLRSALLTLVITLNSESARAQVCNGTASFSKGNVQLGITFGSNAATDHVARIGGGAAGVHLAVGSTRGPFASVGRSVVYYHSATHFEKEGFAEGRTDNAIARLTSVTAGYAISAGASRNVELCPIAGLILQDGPTLYRICDASPGSGAVCSGSYEGDGSAGWLGGQIGASIGDSPTFRFLPFVSIAYIKTKMTAEASDGSRESTADYVGISTGIGIVIKRLTIRPAISFPAGLDAGKPVAGFDFVMSIGPQKPAQ